MCTIHCKRLSRCCDADAWFNRIYQKLPGCLWPDFRDKTGETYNAAITDSELFKSAWIYGN